MNIHFIHLGIVLSLFALNSNGMVHELADEHAASQLAETVTYSEADLVFKDYYENKLYVATALLMRFNKEYSPSEIPKKRDRKVNKARERYEQQCKALAYKSVACTAVAIGAGYYTYKGCTTPETTLAGGATSAVFAIFASKYGFEWYCLPRPTCQTVAEQLKHRMHSSSYDARGAILIKISKMLSPEFKEKQ